MKDIPSGLLKYLRASGGAEIATCWKMELTDGQVLGFTDHDSSFQIDDVYYDARTGYTRTAVASNNSLAVDNMDLQGAISTAGLSKEGLRQGLYDYANLEIFIVNPNDIDAGRVILRRGVLGEITMKDGIYVTEVRGLTQILSRQLLRVFTPECSWRIYDAKCTVSPITYTNVGTVVSVPEKHRVITASITGTVRPSGFFSNGLLTFTSGQANGRSIEIKTHATTGAVETITFILDLQWDFKAGDTFTIRRGCDQLFETCKNVFNNIENFGGFPDVPGSDKMQWYPDDPS